jgi:hypothetical protein
MTTLTKTFVTAAAFAAIATTAFAQIAWDFSPGGWPTPRKTLCLAAECDSARVEERDGDRKPTNVIIPGCQLDSSPASPERNGQPP